MIYTNDYHLPDEIVAAIKAKDYEPKPDPYRVSVTTFKDAPLKAFLRKKYHAEIVTDVADQFWALKGDLFHSLMEKHTDGAITAEQKWEVAYKEITLVGKQDHYNAARETIRDWKTTTAYLSDDKVLEWEKQLNMYAWMARKQGLKVSNIEIVGEFRDWMKRSADEANFGMLSPLQKKLTAVFKERFAKDPGKIAKCKYPPVPVLTFSSNAGDLKLWSDEECEEYIEGRYQVFIKAIKLYVEDKVHEITPCTAEERWAKGEAWAVMKEGQKQAIRGGVCKSLAEAEEVAGDDPKLSIQHRPGSDKNCLEYCQVAEHCPYFRKIYYGEQ